VNSHGRKAVDQVKQMNDEARRAGSEGDYRSFGPHIFSRFVIHDLPVVAIEWRPFGPSGSLNHWINV